MYYVLLALDGSDYKPVMRDTAMVKFKSIQEAEKAVKSLIKSCNILPSGADYLILQPIHPSYHKSPEKLF